MKASATAMPSRASTSTLLSSSTSVALEHLQRDRHPVARRRRRQHRIVRPEARDGALLRRSGSCRSRRPRAPPCRSRSPGPRCRRAAAAARRSRRSAWRRCGSCPSRAEAATCCWRDRAGRHPMRRALGQLVARAGSPCSRRPRRRRLATSRGCARRPPCRRLRCARRHRRATPSPTSRRSFFVMRGDRALAGRTGVGEEVLRPRPPSPR